MPCKNFVKEAIEEEGKGILGSCMVVGYGLKGKDKPVYEVKKNRSQRGGNDLSI